MPSKKKKKGGIGRRKWGRLKCTVSFLVLIGCLSSHLMVPFLMEINFKTQSPWMEFIGCFTKTLCLKIKQPPFNISLIIIKDEALCGFICQKMAIFKHRTFYKEWKLEVAIALWALPPLLCPGGRTLSSSRAELHHCHQGAPWSRSTQKALPAPLSKGRIPWTVFH